LTAREIAERVLVAANVTDPNAENLRGSVLASLRNYKGKSVQRTNEGGPARWQLKEAAK
jgi:hypothetical protein